MTLPPLDCPDHVDTKCGDRLEDRPKQIPVEKAASRLQARVDIWETPSLKDTVCYQVRAVRHLAAEAVGAGAS